MSFRRLTKFNHRTQEPFLKISLKDWSPRPWIFVSTSKAVKELEESFFHLFAFLISQTWRNLRCRLCLDCWRVRLGIRIRQRWVVTWSIKCCTTMKNFVCDIFIVFWVSNYNFFTSFLLTLFYVVCLHFSALGLCWLFLLLHRLVRLHAVLRVEQRFFVKMMRLLMYVVILKHTMFK